MSAFDSLRPRFRLLTLAAFLAATSLADPAATPTPAPGPKRVVLVEAQGANAQVEPFVSRFLSEVSDRSDIAIVDARLSGAHVSELKLTPPTDTAKSFKAEWPADLYLAITLPECTTKSRSSSVAGFDDPITGQRTHRTVRSLQTECTATVSLIDAREGKPAGTVTVSGTKNEDPESADASSDPTEGAEQDAAERAAKKLFPRRR